MPQQGFGPLIKSREVHLENLRLVRGVGFLLVIPFVIEPGSYENTTSEWWDGDAAETLYGRNQNSAQRSVSYDRGLKAQSTLTKW